MSNKNDKQSKDLIEAEQPTALQVNVKMQQGEHAGQPIYSNFTAVQAGQGMVIVDFGFLDPQVINALNQRAKSGDKKKADVVNARMSSRMVLNSDTASSLMR